MKSVMFIGVVAFVLWGCASKELRGYEQGGLVQSGRNIRREQQSVQLKTEFEKVTESKLKVRVQEIKQIKQRYEDVYSKIGIYEKRCKGWRSGTVLQTGIFKSEYCDFNTPKFVLGHLLGIGFLYDLTIPFESYDEKVVNEKANAGDLVVDRDSVVTEMGEPLNGPIELILGKRSYFSKLTNGEAIFNSALLPKQTDHQIDYAVKIKFADEILDVSSEFAQFDAELWNRRQNDLANASRKKEDAINRRIEQKNEVLCRGGKYKFCNRLPLKEPAGGLDLVAYLDPSAPANLELLALYTGQSFEVIQKVAGGYIFTGNRQYFRNLVLGSAYLETDLKIAQGSSFCAWFYNIGTYRYIALDGFERSIPAFRIYNGAAPRENPYCNSGENLVNLGGRLLD